VQHPYDLIGQRGVNLLHWLFGGVGVVRLRRGVLFVGVKVGVITVHLFNYNRFN
jgi:hypothetical protein